MTEHSSTIWKTLKRDMQDEQSSHLDPPISNRAPHFWKPKYYIKGLDRVGGRGVGRVDVSCQLKLCLFVSCQLIFFFHLSVVMVIIYKEASMA